MSLAAAPDGTVYVGSATSNQIVQVKPDDSAYSLAGTVTADPGTTAQMGNGLELNFTPTGLALTPNNGLLISSGHVVYRLQDPAQAGLAILGSPLSFVGGCPTQHWSPTPTSSPSTTLIVAPCPGG